MKFCVETLCSGPVSLVKCNAVYVCFWYQLFLGFIEILSLQSIRDKHKFFQVCIQSFSSISGRQVVVSVSASELQVMVYERSILRVCGQTLQLLFYHKCTVGTFDIQKQRPRPLFLSVRNLPRYCTSPRKVISYCRFSGFCIIRIAKTFSRSGFTLLWVSTCPTYFSLLHFTLFFAEFQIILFCALQIFAKSMVMFFNS